MGHVPLGPDPCSCYTSREAAQAAASRASGMVSGLFPPSQQPRTWKACAHNVLTLVTFALWRFSGPSSGSPLPSVTPWATPVFLHITELSFQCQLREAKPFPKRIFRGLSFHGSPQILVGGTLWVTPWFSARATFYLAEMTVESLIFFFFLWNNSCDVPSKCSRKAEGVSFVPRTGKTKCQREYSFRKLPFLQWIGTLVLLLLLLLFCRRQVFMPFFFF